MPPVAAAISFQVFLAGGWAAIIQGALINMAVSFALSGLAKMLAPSPKGGGAGVQNSGITQQVRQAIIVRKPTYGEMRRSGGVLFIGSSETNKYLHMIIEVAPHEIEEIGEVWLNDYSIAPDHLDADGNVTTGRYSGLVRIRKYLGTSTQTADSFLTAECPEWTTNHRLRGVAYIYIRLKWDSNKFPSGVPNISAWIRGKKVYNSRTTLTEYSENPALILNDFMRDATFGAGCASSEIDQSYLTAAANTCDEFVTVTDYSETVSSVADSTDIITLSADRLFFQRGDRVQLTTTGALPSGLSLATNYYVIPYQRKSSIRIKLASSYANALAGTAVNITSSGSGTHTITKNAEPRYAGAIVVNTEQDWRETAKDMLAGMVGEMAYSNGVFKIMAGAYQTPTVYFNEGDIVSPVTLTTRISTRERFNTVRGVYTSPIFDGESTDYPQVTSATYVANDLETVVKQIDMPMTTRPHMAQRMAKIALELSRQEITWSADFNLSALQVIAGDNAYFTFSKFGWTDKIFKIVDWEYVMKDEGGLPTPIIRMTMREIASACYDWAAGEETAVDLAINSALPDPFTVAAVSGLGVSSELVTTQNGDNTYKILLQWSAATDQYVINGGFYEIEYKLSAESVYRPTYRVPADFTFAEVTLAAELNTNYDIRMRAVNSVGVRSDYTYFLNYHVGSSGAVGSTEDWGTFTGADSPATTSADWGTFTGGDSPATSTEDWEYFS